MRLISECQEPVQKPSISQILDEIEMVCIHPFRAAYELLTSDDFCQGTVENLLFATLGMWEKLSDEISECFSERRKKTMEAFTKMTAEEQVSIFANDRFWEYVAQLRIDKHDPADILESWLKEHNPDYFKD